MSDSWDNNNKQKQSCAVHATDVRSTKSTISSRNNNKFTLIDAACETNLDSIRKLNDRSDDSDNEKQQLKKVVSGCSEQYCLGNERELNNNSIHTLNFEKSGLFKMDSSKGGKPINATAPIAKSSTTTTTAATPSDLSSLEKGDHSLHSNRGPASYASIFSTGQPQSKAGSRGPLKKQAELDEQAPVATIDRLSSQGGPSGGHYNKNIANHSEEDDELDDEIDERLPFHSSSMTKQGSSRGQKSPELKGYPTPKHHHHQPQQQQQQQKDNRCDFAGVYPQQQHKSNNSHGHTKISFNDSRPPSFNTCQFNHHLHDNDTNNGAWREQCSHSSCTGCYPSEAYRKPQQPVKHGIPFKDDVATLDSTKYSKTRSFHLMLKSVILVLLTLLLLMLFIGIILASHYLPQMFERLLGATRSFNVTIAG